MRERIKEAKRIVIKIGSSTLTYQNTKLNFDQIDLLIRQIANLKNQGKEIVLVSSGAVAAGQGKLDLHNRPKTIPQKQALAAVGQGLLINVYQKFFSEYGHKVAQVLLTGQDLTIRKRYLNSRNTLNQLLDYGVIPIINENDTVAVEEIKFGDNDTLSALVGGLIEADLLVVLSDIDGLYTADPRVDSSASLIKELDEITKEVEELAGGEGSERGTGGMRTKITAAEVGTKAGISVIIANGSSDRILTRINEGEELGTLFLPEEGLRSRDKWIAFNLDIEGKLVVDSGAVKAILNSGSSLLPCGIIKVEGEFVAGAVVDVVNEEDERVAKGLVNYSKEEVVKIKGLQSSQIKNQLGYHDYDEVIHRDNLVCF